MKSCLYSQIANKLKDRIRCGILNVGERMPSIRQVATQEQVSISTAMAAYNELEDQGWVEVRKRSGYYVRRRIQEPLAVPKIVAMQSRPVLATTSQLVMDVQLNGSLPHAVSFSQALPAVDLPIIRHVQQAYTRLSRTQRHMCLGYDSPEGYYPLRKQIARHSLDAGVAVSPDTIVTTLGSLNAMSLCIQILTKPGDVVAVETPCYFGILQLIEAYGLKVIEIPVHPETGMSIEALRLAIEQWPLKAVLVVSSFSNPLGCSIPDERKRELMSLLEEYHVPLIEDDIYGDLNFNEKRSVAIKSFDCQGMVLLCSSMSKTINPQLRVGWILAGRYYEKILYRKFVNMLSTPVLPQMVCAEILSQGIYDRHLRLAREVYRNRYERLVDLISEYFPSDTKISRPQGGIVAWVELPACVDTTELYYHCRDHGVLIAPGALFSLNNRFRSCLRINYAPAWTDERENAIRNLGGWIAEKMGQSEANGKRTTER